MRLTRAGFLALLIALMSVTAPRADEVHRFVIVYKAREVDPSRSYSMFCPNNPDCNTVYVDVERTLMFSSKEQSIEYMNQEPQVWNAWTTIPREEHVDITPENLIGLYELKDVQLTQYQTGTKTQKKTYEVNENVPVMKWRLP